MPPRKTTTSYRRSEPTVRERARAALVRRSGMGAMHSEPRIEGEFLSEQDALQALEGKAICQNKVISHLGELTKKQRRAVDYLWLEHDWQVLD